jgi:hypothetical protein
MQQELTLKAVKVIGNDMLRAIQRSKVNASKVTITQLQNTGQLPPNKDITSYVTSTKGARNRFDNIGNFYKVMEQSPKLWSKRFIYVPKQTESNERIAEAAAMAIKLVQSKTQAYPRIETTGHLLGSIRTYVNGLPVNAPVTQLRNSAETPLFELTNTAEYGSTAEARAVYVTHQNGLLFYAANRVQTKFPELGIMFRYGRAEDFGLPHVYNVPVLTIGSTEDVSGPWVRPGENMRRRKKQRRRISSAVNRIVRNL